MPETVVRAVFIEFFEIIDMTVNSPYDAYRLVGHGFNETVTVVGNGTNFFTLETDLIMIADAYDQGTCSEDITLEYDFLVDQVASVGYLVDTGDFNALSAFDVYAVWC